MRDRVPLRPREDGDKAFTAKVPVDFQMAQKKNVEFAFTPGKQFSAGSLYDTDLSEWI